MINSTSVEQAAMDKSPGWACPSQPYYYEEVCLFQDLRRKKKEEIKERKISWWGSEAINLGTTNGKKYSWGVVKLPRRRSEEEHCRQGGERPPFVAIYSDFLTDFENLFWWFDSHPGRATTSNWLVASPTTCPGACLPLLTSAIARNLPKAPDQSTQPPPAIIFRVDVRPA